MQNLCPARLELSRLRESQALISDSGVFEASVVRVLERCIERDWISGEEKPRSGSAKK
jgi:hypothetical protein